MSASEHTSVQIYTDGGCDPNPGPGGWGAVLIAGLRTREISGADPQTTNNRMEISAAVAALRLLKQPCDITLYTDSQYLRKSVTQWIDGWVAHGWRKANGRPVENADLWQELLVVMAPHHITWEWLRGHRGNPLNERADQLATEARRRLRAGNPPPPLVTRAPESLPDVSLYTRGCALGSPGPGGFAAIIVDAEGQTRPVFGGWPLATSNVMDLWAAVAGLQALKQVSHATVYSTNKYVLDGATRWLAQWERAGWHTAEGQPVKNQEIWAELGHVLGDHNVDWEYLPDADRNSHYRRAIQLARQEAERLRT